MSLDALAKGIAAAGAAAGLINEIAHLVDYMAGDAVTAPPVLQRLPTETRSKIQKARDRAKAAKAFGV